MRVLAIEKDERRHERLVAAMRPFTDCRPTIARVHHGTLTDLLAKSAGQVKKAPVLYFLDPFGVEGLLGEADLRLALAGPHNEVFALFSDTGAKRLHATLLSEERDVEYEVEQVRNAPSLFAELNELAVAEKRAEVERSTAALRRTQEASQRILDGALGPEAVRELAGVPLEERPARATQIYLRSLRNAGAKYVLSFPVRDSRNAAVYQLVHASKSKQGLRTMKESMQAALNSSSLPDEVREGIRYALRVSEREVVAGIRKEFAGQEVRWTVDNDRGGERTIRKYLLEETPTFPGQFEEIKKELVAAGFRTSSRPLAFRFPPAP